MTTFIVNMINSFVNYLSLNMQRFDIESGTFTKMSDGINAVATFLVDVNFIIPLGDIAAIIVICLSAEVAKFMAFAINWVVRRICDVIP